MRIESVLSEYARQSLEATTRRHFLKDCATGMGAMWLAMREAPSAIGQEPGPATAPLPHHPAKVKRVIYLHMVGAPSQFELFDYKPELARYDGQACPAEIIDGRRFAFIQGVPKLLGPQFEFAQHGESGAYISTQMPRFAEVVDEVCFIRTMQTDQFNHGPAQLMIHTGQPRIGYPSMGSWVTWGLGSENEDIPGFIVLISGGRLPRVGKALWSAGFLNSVYQGVQCRSSGDPVINVSNPAGISREDRRAMLDALAQLNEKSYNEFGDPETLTRIAQYEMAYRMQAAAPEVMDINQEPAEVHASYGTQPGRESFANNCLLARRLVERGVRFVQLFDWGWDSHGAAGDEALNRGFQDKCDQVDRPIAALLADLKQRGMLDDTLVVFSGEFGRTPMRELRLGRQESELVGRDHHTDAFTLWLAGGGVKKGFSLGETDPLGFAPATEPIHVRDFHATVLHLLGLDHERYSQKFQGLDQKLTGVTPARVIHEILA
jgi:hypothetical protein